VQAVAEWLAARPQNAVLGLAATLLLPAPQLTSGVILVLLVLAQGTKLALIETGFAAAVLLIVTLLFGISTGSVIALMLGTWLPVLLLSVLLLRTRSLTLTLQVSVIVAVLGLLGFYVLVDDPAAFWQPYITTMAEVVRQNNLQLNTELLTAEIMTVSAVLAFWLLYTVGMLFGYALCRRLPRETGDFGRFRDFSFGRVIAFAAAFASLLALAIGVNWLQNIAFVMFVVFWMQGLAIVHWMHGEGYLPLAAVIAIYALLPFLQVLLMTVLALVGYADAWFGFRRRLRNA
jgi:hypothetical protein